MWQPEKMATTVKDVTGLYAELNRFRLNISDETGNSEYDKAIKICNKILHEAPDEQKAFHCKIVCLIQLNRLDEALVTIRKNPTLGGTLVFEKAYCEYGLNRLQEALKTLHGIQNPSNREQELLGQVLYRMEQYEECLDVYKRLVKNTHDDFEVQREANLAAVISAMQACSTEELDGEGLRDDTYELCYNKTCFLIAQGHYQEALQGLDTAEALCREMYEEDPDAFDNDIDSELSIIRVQRGYVLQQLGRNEEASKLYSLVLKQKPNDVAVVAVAANNVISINKDQNVFDSKKKLKMVSVDSLQHKLTSQQKRAIAMNQALLYMYTNQGEQCLKTAEELQHKYQDSDRPCLIEAAQYCHSKQINKAIDVLKEQVSKGHGSVTLKLTLAQLYLGQGHVYQACDVLRDMGDLSYKPGVVSALVTMYLSQEDKEQASSVLNNAVDWFRKQQPSSPELAILVRANADFQLRHGDPQVAADMLEHLRKRDPKDLKTLAQLISAYSKFDPKKAQLVSRELPSPEEMDADVDVEALETAASTFGAKFIRKVNKAEASPKPVSPNAATDDKKKKKKKHKKGKLPKHMDPDNPPDPERWLPRRERSYYRGKRKDKRQGIGKGSQGAANVNTDLDANRPASASGSEVGSPRPGQTVTPSGGNPQPSTTGPRQQNPGGKRKKKKGAKW